MIDAINDGRFLVFHRDHGGISGWGSPSFGSSNLASLTNGAKTPVVYSINCASGLFDNETRNPANDVYTYNTSVGGSYWAERILRMEGGAVGVIGDTRNSPTWANSAFARGLFDATWPDLLPADGGNTSIRRLGDILNYGKVYLIGQVCRAPELRLMSRWPQALTDVTLYHVYGDPTMAMWTNISVADCAALGIADDFRVIEAEHLGNLAIPSTARPSRCCRTVCRSAVATVVNGDSPDGAASKTSIPKRPTSCRPACPGPSAWRWPCPTPRQRHAGERRRPEQRLRRSQADLPAQRRAPVPVKLFYEELPVPSVPIVGTDWLAPVGAAQSAPARG